MVRVVTKRPRRLVRVARYRIELPPVPRRRGAETRARDNSADAKLLLVDRLDEDGRAAREVGAVAVVVRGDVVIPVRQRRDRQRAMG